MDINIIKSQNGRSMIEMLGVLAIIGVLSVGGIAGFSKAMNRYRVNETLNQITHIVQNTRDLFKTQPNLYGDMKFSSSKKMSDTTFANRILADKAKLFPTSIVKNDYKNMFGGDIGFYADGRFSNDDGKAFILRFEGIPQEACIDIATHDWRNSLGIIVMRVYGAGTDDSSVGNNFLGNCTSKYNQGDVLACVADIPLTVEQAVTACFFDKNNKIVWKFY